MDMYEDDLALVRRWFQRLQLCVQTVDYIGSRPLFAEDMITFGSYTAFTVGRDATETEQWRHVWGQIDQFRWRLDDLRTILSRDRLTAVAMAVFESTGYTEDGKPFDRPGRATVRARAADCRAGVDRPAYPCLAVPRYPNEVVWHQAGEAARPVSANAVTRLRRTAGLTPCC